MCLSSRAIALFDSGVGGLTVLQQLIKALPCEHMIYFGDNARLPYGNKSPETVVHYSIENTRGLLEKNIKLLVIACNTASAWALSELRQLFDIPILGVIEPGAKKAVTVTRNQRIAVLGTKGTIQSGAYQAAIQKLAPQALVFPVPCPLLVPLVEERWFNHPATQLIIREYLHPLRDQAVDTVILGCTHYPLIRTLIQQEMGDHVILVDPASTCAEEVVALLQQHQLLAMSQQGTHKYYTSGDPENFRSLGKDLFGYSLDSVEIFHPKHS